MADAIIEFDGFETYVAGASMEDQFYVDMIQCERWDDAGNSCDVVFIDRGGHSHQRLDSGELELPEEYSVEIVDLYQEWVEYSFRDEDGLMIGVKGAIGISETSRELDSLVESSIQFELVAREDGDSPVLPYDFEIECAGTLNSVDHDWTA